MCLNPCSESILRSIRLTTPLGWPIRQQRVRHTDTRDIRRPSSEQNDEKRDRLDGSAAGGPQLVPHGLGFNGTRKAKFTPLSPTTHTIIVQQQMFSFACRSALITTITAPGWPRLWCARVPAPPSSLIPRALYSVNPCPRTVSCFLDKELNVLFLRGSAR